MTTTPSTDAARLRLVEITQRLGVKITARDVATAHLAIAAIEHLRDLAEHNQQIYSNTLRSSVHRGVQLDAARALLAEIREIIE